MNSRKTVILMALAMVAAGAGWYRYFAAGVGADMTVAAQEFLASLSDQQRTTAVVPYDSAQRVQWHFIPMPTRKGLQIKEMDAPQRKKALALMQAGLSQVGYDKATTIMSLEAILRELEKERRSGPIRDPERYYFTIFGTPAATGQWGFSVEGHHLSLNFAVSDGKLSSHTPAFFGANPTTVHHHVHGGPEVGHRTLAQEEDLAFKLLGSLSAQQRKLAVIAGKAPADIRAAGQPQPPETAAEGLAAAMLADDQSAVLWALIETYARNMAPEIADARLDEIKQAGLDKVHFAWAGADRPGIGHYYRVQGPTFLIELVNTQPDSAGNPASHIHSVWRDLRGDFGIQP